METICKKFYVKFVLIGDSNTGKTSLISAFSKKQFLDNVAPTIGIDFFSQPLTVGNKQVNLRIWDTAGQERFQSLTSAYYKGSHAFFFVFSVDKRRTFENIPFWIEQVKKKASLFHGVGPNGSPIIYLVGNKSDNKTQREVTKDEAKLLAKNYGFNYIETSAKTGQHVDFLFEDALKQVNFETIQSLMEHSSPLNHESLYSTLRKEETREVMSKCSC